MLDGEGTTAATVCSTCQHTPLYCRCGTSAVPRTEVESPEEYFGRIKVMFDGKHFFTTQDILDVMVAMQEGPVREIFVRNNAAYAETDRTDDGFNNFREGAAEEGIDVLQYWGVLFGKHRRALSAFRRTGVSHKPVYRIIKDMIVYLHMLNAWLIERGDYTLEEVLGDRDNG